MGKLNRPDLFNWYLQLPTDELEWELGGSNYFEPDEIGFLVNPRRLRGSDFLMRWAQGRWSEEVVERAFNQTSQFGVIPMDHLRLRQMIPMSLNFSLKEWM